MTYMTGSKKLACGSANRMISFYKLDSSQHQNIVVDSRIEDLVAIPTCLEYFKWPESSNKNDKYETLLCGDGLGICHLWDFEKDWHICQYKEGSLEPMGCSLHKEQIIETFKSNVEAQYDEIEKEKKAAKAKMKK